ncbi:MAG: superoxide dismutase [Deltaproteobacteria bacterium]|nr:superoxide dismutase [Deltaproteobacteria bacterium]
MKNEVIELPYAKDALSPAMSAETLEFHYEKHHKGYFKKLDAVLEDSEKGQTLEEIVKAASGGKFNNAAQVYNHNLFWLSMKPGGGGAPSGDLADAIERDFGGLDAFKTEWKAKGAGQFGSGWVWLVLDGGELSIVATGNAETPLTTGATPLMTMDVWEHAYYLDHRNDRGAFIDVWLEKLVSWDEAARRLKG